MEKEYITKCPYKRQNYCMLRDDNCAPNSLKCKKNKRVFHDNTFSTTTKYKKKFNKQSTESHRQGEYVLERYGSNRNISTIETKGNISLFVFKGFLNLKKENTVDYYIYVNDICTKKRYKLLVAYNSKIKRYYISDTQIRKLHKAGIYPQAFFYICNVGSIPFNKADFREFSKLALYGYSAGKNGLNRKERHKILKHILDNRILTRYQIIEHLQGLIHLRERRKDKDFSIAIKNWEDDIAFVNDYSLYYK